MRSNAGPIQAPNALNLKSLGTLLPQNQLRLVTMARMQARHDPGQAAERFGWPRLPRPASALLLLGVAASGGLALIALVANGAGELVVQGVLALLAVAGAFLLFGLLFGYLRLSERVAEAEMVKAVADGLDNGLEIVNQQGVALYRNRALQRLTGRRAGRQATLEELFAGEPDSAQAFFRLNRAAERGEPRDEEFYAEPTGGARTGRWLRVGVRPFAGPSGDAKEGQRLTLWQVVDVTRERTREIETVSGLEATLSFYDSLPQGLFAVTPEGRIAHVNATLSQWLRLRTEPGRTLSLLDIVPADGADLIRAVARSSQGRATRLELDLLREDGRVFPAELICRGHGPRGIISALVLDRSAEPTRAEAQAHTEVRLTRVFQSAPFGIATADASGRIATANAAFMRMFAAEGRGVPSTVAGLVPDGEEEAGRELAKALERAVSGRTAGAPIEVFFGAQRELARRVYVSALGAGGRAREGAVLYAIDATEQKALEQKFAQSHKMEAVGKLAGGVAHDFNNVLTAIIGFSDLLLQTHRQTDPAYRDIMNIKSSANRAAGLVRQLLAFSRRQTMQAEVLELGEVLTDLSALLNRAMGEKMELKILSGRDLWYVKADKTQFEQVIINLAVNARDAMPDGGCLTIRTRNVSERESLKHAGAGMAAGEYVLIEVEDTGVGMTADVMGKIFEPFFSTKEVGKGTGLGLSTAYGIVKQTGGYIFADSELAKGTTFRVYLPRHIVENEEEIAQPREKKREATRDLTGSGRVLLVEDEDVVRNFAARALARQGYEVLEAGTGIEALEVMEREKGKVDIVVSDVIMPEMDGPTLLKELRKTNPNLKFIFVSGYPDDAFKKSLDDNEAYTFLPKPFTLPQLAAKVKEQLAE
ncbi:MAG TPA: response regulator [Hyphomicrobiaceae bacterium]|nr:response regulator [Hyphomicrobiaceae bacterium]